MDTRNDYMVEEHCKLKRYPKLLCIRALVLTLYWKIVRLCYCPCHKKLWSVPNGATWGCVVRNLVYVQRVCPLKKSRGRYLRGKSGTFGRHAGVLAKVLLTILLSFKIYLSVGRRGRRDLQKKAAIGLSPSRPSGSSARSAKPAKQDNKIEASPAPGFHLLVL